MGYREREEYETWRVRGVTRMMMRMGMREWADDWRESDQDE